MGTDDDISSVGQTDSHLYGWMDRFRQLMRPSQGF